MARGFLSMAAGARERRSSCVAISTRFRERTHGWRRRRKYGNVFPSVGRTGLRFFAPAARRRGRMVAWALPGRETGRADYFLVGDLHTLCAIRRLFQFF